MWKVYGNYLANSEVDGTDTSQAMGFTIPEPTVILGIRTWFVFYNSPAFTALRLRIYENRGGVAGKLLATSTNSFVTAGVQTLAYALKGVYFDFDKPSLKGGIEYFCLPYVTGYTSSDSSHISWVKSFPDPEYRGSLDLTYEGMHVMPYRFAVVGASL